jgi:hypothetical protein
VHVLVWLQVGCLEHWSVLVTGVTPMSLRPLITVGNQGVWSCLDIV